MLKPTGLRFHGSQGVGLGVEGKSFMCFELGQKCLKFFLRLHQLVIAIGGCLQRWAGWRRISRGSRLRVVHRAKQSFFLLHGPPLGFGRRRGGGHIPKPLKKAGKPQALKMRLERVGVQPLETACLGIELEIHVGPKRDELTRARQIGGVFLKACAILGVSDRPNAEARRLRSHIV